MQTISQVTSRAPASRIDRPLLFTTKTCPACRVITKWLDERGLIYDKIYAEEAPQAAEKYNVRSVPAMVVMHVQRGEERLVGVSEIKRYFSS